MENKKTFKNKILVRFLVITFSLIGVYLIFQNEELIFSSKVSFAADYFFTHDDPSESPEPGLSTGVGSPVEDENISDEISWWNSLWKYRQSVSITNEGSENLEEYQQHIVVNTIDLISVGKMNSSCNDLRFTSESGNELSYWIESGCNTTSTSIWIKVSDLDLGSNILYMYYGNLSASAKSSGEDTFIVFDDFNDGVLSSEWTVDQMSSGAITETNGELRIYEYRNYYAHIQKQINNNTFVVQAKIRATKSDSGASWAPGISLNWLPTTISSTTTLRNRYDRNNIDGLGLTGSGYGDTYYHWYRIDVGESTLTGYKSDNGSLWTKGSAYDRGEARYDADVLVIFGKGYPYNNTYKNPELNNNYNGTRGSKAYSFIDDVFVREYADIEPVVSEYGSEEQYKEITTFSSGNDVTFPITIIEEFTLDTSVCGDDILQIEDGEECDNGYWSGSSSKLPLDDCSIDSDNGTCRYCDTSICRIKTKFENADIPLVVTGGLVALGEGLSETDSAIELNRDLKWYTPSKGELYYSDTVSYGSGDYNNNVSPAEAITYDYRYIDIYRDILGSVGYIEFKESGI